jgi:hypothetical protein
MLYKKRIFFGFFLFLSLSLAISCDSDEDEMKYHFVALEISDVDLPESFQLNETYEIGITYRVPNSCTSLEGFDVSSEELTVRRVVAIGAEIQEQACTEAVEELQTSFQFVCLYSETYLFRFYAGDDETGEPLYLEVEVPVN